VSLSTVERARLARAVAAGAVQTAGVARLSPGHGVEAATYYPGGKIQGVIVRDDGSVEVHVVLAALPVADVVERVQRSVEEGAGAGYGGQPRVARVDVVVEDLMLDHLPEHPAVAGASAAHGNAPMDRGAWPS
jgi:hypothetical protein